MVGFAENVGHQMTYLVLTESNKVVPRSELCSAESADDKNIKTEPLGGEIGPSQDPVIKSRHDSLPGSENGESKMLHMPVFLPSDLIGHSFLMDKQDDGQCHHTRIVEAIQDFENELEKDPDGSSSFAPSMEMTTRRSSPTTKSWSSFRRMKPLTLSGSTVGSLDMKGHSSKTTPTTMDPVTMS